jgi:CheY-like chemotaxis protein
MQTATSPSSSRLHRSTARVRSRRLSVLLVDDDADARHGFAAYLRSAGLDVETADSGTEALEMTSAFTPDVIVLNDALPPPGGQNVIDTLRAHGNTAAIPSVLFTGPSPDKRAGERADVCLSKPCTPARLLDVVRLLGARA